MQQISADYESDSESEEEISISLRKAFKPSAPSSAKSYFAPRPLVAAGPIPNGKAKGGGEVKRIRILSNTSNRRLASPVRCRFRIYPRIYPFRYFNLSPAALFALLG